MNIGAIFNKTFNGQKNFITPTIVEFGQTGNFIFEISKGSGFSNDTIYGVTVLKLNGKEVEKTDLSNGGFESLEKAREYAKALE